MHIVDNLKFGIDICTHEHQKKLYMTIMRVQLNPSPGSCRFSSMTTIKHLPNSPGPDRKLPPSCIRNTTNTATRCHSLSASFEAASHEIVFWNDCNDCQLKRRMEPRWSWWSETLNPSRNSAGCQASSTQTLKVVPRALPFL